MRTETTITELTHDDLVNLLCTATYGSNWLTCAITRMTRSQLDIQESDCREDVWAKALLAGHPVYLTDHQAEGCTYGDKGTIIDAEGETACYRITLEDIKAGLADAFDGNFEPADEDECELGFKCAMHLRDETTDFDNYEAEVLMQIIMFGSIIY